MTMRPNREIYILGDMQLMGIPAIKGFGRKEPACHCRRLGFGHWVGKIP